ncbi:hypothetical protein C8R47DRAFT_1148007, partial [Mycena vitilis]
MQSWLDSKILPCLCHAPVSCRRFALAVRVATEHSSSDLRALAIRHTRSPSSFETAWTWPLRSHALIPRVVAALGILDRNVLGNKQLPPEAFPDFLPRAWTWFKYLDTYSDSHPELDGTLDLYCLVVQIIYRPRRDYTNGNVFDDTPGLRTLLVQAWARIITFRVCNNDEYRGIINKHTVKRCAVCQLVYYCSQECQLHDIGDLATNGRTARVLPCIDFYHKNRTAIYLGVIKYIRQCTEDDNDFCVVIDSRDGPVTIGQIHTLTASAQKV